MEHAFRRLLVFQDDSKQCRTWTGQAAELAARWKASLLGLHVELAVMATTYTDASIGEGLEQAQKELERARNRRVHQDFLAASEQAGVSAEWVARVGDPAVEMRRMARCADLAVIGSVSRRSDDLNDLRRVAEHVAVGSGCPTLVVPESYSEPIRTGKIVLCWDGSREAARAVRDALPILQEASEVQVLFADEGEWLRPGLSDDLLSGHLKAHGIDAEIRKLPAEHRNAGRPLLEQATAFGADMIVLGAYGHARLRELVLGGVTSHMLRAATVPILLAH